MAIIRKESRTQVIVFAVSIDSPRSIHVKTGKTRYDIEKAKNLTDQADSLNAAYPYFEP
tara:strand:- start:431 stop:607 length:177 start_codon:yes stop_codon:yes gene_type:complete